MCIVSPKCYIQLGVSLHVLIMYLLITTLNGTITNRKTHVCRLLLPSLVLHLIKLSFEICLYHCVNKTVLINMTLFVAFIYFRDDSFIDLYTHQYLLLCLNLVAQVTLHYLAGAVQILHTDYCLSV